MMIRYKKWIILCAVEFFILVMLFIMSGCKKNIEGNKNTKNSLVQSENISESENNNDIDPVSFFADEWNLILVNADNAIPDNYYFEMTELDNGRCVDSRIYPDLQEMFDEMRKDGIYPIVGEGWRSAEEQQCMMDDYINAYINEGYSKSESEEMAKNMVAGVGYSEHQLGLAVDINADEGYCSDNDVYAWLAENAYKYGFILRYPQNKTDITGIDFEPWHYRYVGKKAAKEIYLQNICLEEYLYGVN